MAKPIIAARDQELPLVSIVIPCYNAESYVAEAIQSALDQTYGNCEIIVIDDGSTDSSLEVIRSFGNRIQWETGPNRGGCAARNRGLALAGGEWIQYLDADDKLSEHKIESQLNGVRNAKDSKSLLVCPWVHFDESGKGKTFNLRPYMHLGAGVEVLVKMWCRGEMFAPHCWLTPRSLIESVGPWNETLTVDQDGEYFGRVLCSAEDVQCFNDGRAFYRKPGPMNVSSSVGGKAMASRFEAWESVKNCLFETRTDKYANRAVLNRLRSVAYQGRAYSDIIRRAHLAEKEIGREGFHFSNQSLYSILSSLVGLKAALKIRACFKK